MTDRQAFEAWAGKRERAPTTSAWDYAFRAWQAATAAERERCAKVADSMNTFGLPPDVAAEIRKGPPI